MILDFRRTRRRKDAARLVAAEKRRKCVSAYVMDIGLMCGQARDAHIFIFAVIEVARFQDESFPNVMLARVVVIDTRLVRGNVWAAINFAFEYRSVIDLVNFQHVGFQRFFVSEGHGTGRFVTRDTRQAFFETVANKLVVHSTNVTVVFFLNGR